MIIVTLRVALISLSGILLGISTQLQQSQFLIVFILMTIVLQTWWLIRYTTVTNRNLQAFLISLKFLDEVNNKIPDDKSFRELNLTYNDIINVVKEAKLDAESERHFFQTILDQVNVGILSFDELGRVEIFNRTGSELLGITKMRYLNDLERLHLPLFNTISHLSQGEVEIVNIDIKGSNHKLSCRSAQLNIVGFNKTVISFQDIQNELDQGELIAWKRLIRVLTHEILNSVTPIKSLSGSIKRMLSNGSTEITEEQNIKVANGLDIINKHSIRLADFISSYKQMIKLPSPVISEIQLQPYIENIFTLMGSDLAAHAIKYEYNVKPDDLHLNADLNMLQQVLINLLSNALDSLSKTEHPKIKISAFSKGGVATVDIIDNGHGIPSEVIDQVFIPYFSTKKDGMGIGLSLSKQIMQMHGGTLSILRTDSERGTAIRLSF